MPYITRSSPKGGSCLTSSAGRLTRGIRASFGNSRKKSRRSFRRGKKKEPRLIGEESINSKNSKGTR